MSNAHVSRYLRARAGRVAVAAVVVVASLTVVATSGGAAAAPAAADYVVVLADGTNPIFAAARFGVVPTAVYTSALSGYSATLTGKQFAKISADAATVSVEADETFSVGDPPAAPPETQPAQAVQDQLERIGGLESPTAHVDGVDERVDVDIAVLDTGIDSTHPDLNVVGGVNCSSGKGYEDVDPVDGHGTMVGGFAAAIDNSIGVVGVAPGARLWAVRVMNKRGNGTNSQLICGIDWVTRHADVIDVANMSLGDFTNRLGGACGTKKVKALHKAICRSVARGVTYVAAAGNYSVDAALFVPAAYPEVIAVSAMADNDGMPGGLGGAMWCLDDLDDTFAWFSNYGAVVDLAAPGVCTVSTYPGGLYGWGSGTSYATPLVAGAAALYLANHPDATPAQVRQALVDRREQTAFADDPDGIAEGVVNVAGL